MNNYKLAASLICANPLKIMDDISELLKNNIDQIHFDVMDGTFVPRHGLYIEILQELRKISNITVDVHVMINNPESYIEKYAQNGANYYCFHIETTQHASRLIEIIKKR